MEKTKYFVAGPFNYTFSFSFQLKHFLSCKSMKMSTNNDVHENVAKQILAFF